MTDVSPQDWKALELPPPEPRPESEPMVEDADGSAAGWSASFGRRQAEISLLQNLGVWARGNLLKGGGKLKKLEVQLGEEFGSFGFIASDVWVNLWVGRYGHPSNTPRRWKLALWLDGVESQA